MNDLESIASTSARRPLVALVLPSDALGGAEVVNVSLAKHLIERGVSVDIVTGWSESEGESLSLPEAARHISFGVQQTRSALWPLIRYLRRERPDVVIASVWPFTSMCVIAHQLAGSHARMVVWEHNTLSVQYGNWGPAHRLMLRLSMSYECRRADVRVAVSSGVADDLSELSGMARDKFDVVYNPVHDRQFVEGDVAAAEAVWGGWTGPRIITVGRFKAQKNHALLLRAFKKLLAVQDARLLILGTGPLVEETRAQALAEGMADKVLTPGAVPDPTPYYASASLFVLSSDHEGFGNVIVEALASGLPVVSTDCKSGPAEILENGRYGLLVPVGDADALASAMTDALASKHDREALKRRAADFAPELISDQFFKLLFKPATQRLRSP